MRVVLFAVTLFTSSALLFVVQPLFARMVVPLLGGTPAVWTTCVLFFQVALLGGYLYGHVTLTRLGLRRAVGLHLVLLLVPLLSLPIAISASWSPPRSANPVPALLLLLATAVGLPFFMVSASGPVIQRWFSGTGDPAAADPYFLYSASNLGSMLGLLGYLVFLEPHFALVQQSGLWTRGYVVLLVLTGACAVAVLRAGPAPAPPASDPNDERPTTNDERRTTNDERRTTNDQGSHVRHRFEDVGRRTTNTLTPLRRLRWIALAFVPSSLMLGLTTYISTDIAAIPLMWVVPLALYLLTFILTFARRQALPHAQLLRLLPILVLVQAVVLARATLMLPWLPLLHLTTFFVVAMACHGELVRDRPPADQLTLFYLLLSVGGALGGLFNAVVAPLVFNATTEYPLALVLACVLCPRPRRGREAERQSEPADAGTARQTEFSKLLDPAEAPGSETGRQIEFSIARRSGSLPGLDAFDFIAPLGLALLAVPLLFMAWRVEGVPRAPSIALGILALLCYLLVERPLRFGLGVGALLLVIALDPGSGSRVLHQERSFFGVHRVTRGSSGRTQLVHGTTVHGMQDAAHPDQPLTYYHRNGPMGQLFSALEKGGRLKRVGVVGLGAGSLACYIGAGQSLTFFEIDAAVDRIAAEHRFFTFLSQARERDAAVDVVLGDARLTLRDARNGRFDLIVLDAFNSDSIATHLLTREAVRTYLAKLAPRGLLAFHISSRCLDLEPILRAAAADARLAYRFQFDREVTDEEQTDGHWPSQWVLMARHESDLGPLGGDPRWARQRSARRLPVWTDDYCNILSAVDWW